MTLLLGLTAASGFRTGLVIRDEDAMAFARAAGRDGALGGNGLDFLSDRAGTTFFIGGHSFRDPNQWAEGSRAIRGKVNNPGIQSENRFDRHNRAGERWEAGTESRSASRRISLFSS